MPRPGSLAESLFINVWKRRKDIDLMLHFVHMLSNISTEAAAEHAMKIMQQVVDMALPSGGDIHRLSANEKKIVEILKHEARQAFRVALPADFGIQEIKSRLAAQRDANR
jgi:hypothetical protein